MDVISDLFTKYNCTNCQEDISGIRVHCAECENFDLCLQCFSCGAEIGSHANTHDYQFMDTGTSILSVFKGKGAWTAREEIRLLDAIEQYGFGNWEDISKHIETKSAEDAKEEYVNKFVNGTIGKHTWVPAQSQRPTLVDHTVDDTGPLGANAMQRLPALDVTTEEATQLGYMPNRDSFEREYDPTAEQLISSLSLTSEDSEADYMLKLAQVDLYTRRLRERVRRKRIVRDYQLVSNFFRNRNYAQQPNLSKEQKEFRDRFRVFAQFFTCNEYERLMTTLEREKELRVRLSELFRYRYNGLTKVDECRHFEQHAAMATHRSTGPYGQGKTDNIIPCIGNPSQHNSSSLSVHHQSQKKGDQQNVVEESNTNFIVPSNMHHTGVPISSAVSLHSKNYLDSCRGSSVLSTKLTTETKMITATGMTMSTTTLPVTTTSKMNQKHPPALQQLLAAKSEPPPIPPHLQLNNMLLPAKQVVEKLTIPQHQLLIQQLKQQHQVILANNNINNIKDLLESQIKETPPKPMSTVLKTQLDALKHLREPLDFKLLTKTEQQICKAFNLSPTSYFSLKTVLLSGAPAPNNLSPIENSLRKFFIKVGWLTH